MPLTVRYRALGPRVTELCHHMLPRPSRLGLYTDRQYDRVRGFIVLGHAEIEYCLEKLAEEALIAAYAGYTADGRMRGCLSSLVSWIPPARHPSGWSGWSATRRVKWSVRFYRKQVVAPNNGASKRHILKLSIPLGILESSLDATWLLLADTVFVKRGRVAHTGIAAQSDPNPADERRDVRNLANGLRELDRLLTQASA